MESKIIKQNKNLFLEREEIIIEIKNSVTPTFDEVKTEIGKPAELIVIKKINTNFGKQSFMIEAVVYDNVEAKEKIETVPQKVKKKIEAEKKDQEKAEKKAIEEAKKAEEEAKKAEEEAKAAEETAEVVEETPAETVEPEVEAPTEAVKDEEKTE